MLSLQTVSPQVELLLLLQVGNGVKVNYRHLLSGSVNEGDLSSGVVVCVDQLYFYLIQDLTTKKNTIV